MTSSKRKSKIDEKPDVIGRGRKNREKVGIGFTDATKERLIHAGRSGSADYLLDEKLAERLESAPEKHRKFLRNDAERQASDQGAPVNPQGVRHVADPFDLLRVRGLLDKEDPALNQVLWFAGAKYRDYYHIAGMVGVGAMDLTKGPVSTSGAGRGPSVNQQVLDAKEELWKANVAIGPRNASLFCGVVLHGETIAEQRRLVTDTKNERTADAIALERLRDCLHRLCDVWHMSARKVRISSSIGEENMRNFEKRS